MYRGQQTCVLWHLPQRCKRSGYLNMAWICKVRRRGSAFVEGMKVQKGRAPLVSCYSNASLTLLGLLALVI